ncbi:hypothetical protein HNP46_005750 [Pseudomonas nitritireducens]|uniref:Uncharacterized protein n=1 Tax=Pseudomonas nitroreducens TaxID=46680 RepID=A0A7W7P3C5_PSENT|nr:hypothetical protein [Pseudomonas nitritireducens]MBB4866843.1 hypothetical protein [Pseudomonas nitritireducens]
MEMSVYTEAQRLEIYRLRSVVGTHLGEPERVTWAIQDKELVGYIIDLPTEAQADQYLTDREAAEPGVVEREGLHKVRCSHWEDYLGLHGECAASQRFQEWAFAQDALAGRTPADFAGQASPHQPLLVVVASKVIPGFSFPLPYVEEAPLLIVGE